MMVGEVWIDDPHPGSWNMAMDEAMLEYAAAAQRIVLRCYGWSRPTISLGYFQSYDELANHPMLSSLDCVRRLTGGGGLLHDLEITYSIGIPGDMQRKGHNESLYRSTHRGLVDWLRSLGFRAILWEEANQEARQSYSEKDSFWCFERRSDVDIVVGKQKVVGSAQRRNTHGLLQHGSLLIDTSIWTPQLPGILSVEPDQIAAKVRGKLTVERLGELLQNVLAESLGCDWRKVGPNSNVLERAKAIDTERFSSPKWTRHKNR